MEAYLGESLYYIPQNVVTNEDLERAGGYSKEKISEKIGIHRRYIAGPEEFVSDMASTVGRAFFMKYDIDIKSIDTLILCTQSPDYLIPGPEYLIHKGLGLEDTCKVISFNSGCSGFIYGLEIATAFVRSGKSRRTLLLTSETYSKHIAANDISNRSIFGDAATATLISDTKKHNYLKINDFCFFTKGHDFDKIFNPNSGMRAQTADFAGFQMKGSDVYLFTISIVVNKVKEFLVNSQLTVDDIDFFIFHQASKMVLDSLQKKLKLSDEKFLKYYQEVGNTVSNTIPIVIKNKLAAESLAGKKVLVCGFGVGLSVGVGLLQG